MCYLLPGLALIVIGQLQASSGLTTESVHSQPQPAGDDSTSAVGARNAVVFTGSTEPSTRCTDRIEDSCKVIQATTDQLVVYNRFPYCCCRVVSGPGNCNTVHQATDPAQAAAETPVFLD